MGDGEGQESLACCSPWGSESDMAEQMNNNNGIKATKVDSRGKFSIELGQRLAESKLQLIELRNVSSVQSLSHVQIFATPWTAPCQASLSITNSQS